MATGDEIASLPAETYSIARLSFSPDDRFLAIACVDHHVLIWDITSLRRKLRDIGLDWDVAGTAGPAME
jgi:WD40 repeat protein